MFANPCQAIYFWLDAKAQVRGHKWALIPRIHRPQIDNPQGGDSDRSRAGVEALRTQSRGLSGQTAESDNPRTGRRANRTDVRPQRHRPTREHADQPRTCHAKRDASTSSPTNQPRPTSTGAPSTMNPVDPRSPGEHHLALLSVAIPRRRGPDTVQRCPAFVVHGDV